MSFFPQLAQLGNSSIPSLLNQVDLRAIKFPELTPQQQAELVKQLGVTVEQQRAYDLLVPADALRSGIAQIQALDIIESKLYVAQDDAAKQKVAEAMNSIKLQIAEVLKQDVAQCAVDGKVVVRVKQFDVKDQTGKKFTQSAFEIGSPDTVHYMPSGKVEPEKFPNG